MASGITMASISLFIFKQCKKLKLCLSISAANRIEMLAVEPCLLKPLLNYLSCYGAFYTCKKSFHRFEKWKRLQFDMDILMS
jgi:hypothetical protein